MNFFLITFLYLKICFTLEHNQILWSNHKHKNFLTVIKNQNDPEFCQAGWAFAVTSSLSDRIKIMRNATWPDIQLSPQLLLSCVESNDGCHSNGDNLVLNAFEYIQKYGISDETCSMYMARGHDNGLQCNDLIRCRNCNIKGSCFQPPSYYVYGLSEFQKLNSVDDMMNEIKRGPIVAEICVTNEFLQYQKGIFIDKSECQDHLYKHFVSIVGYAEENGIQFWHVRNSFGSSWGEQGYFRIIRGINNLGIETNSFYGQPIDNFVKKNFTNSTESRRFLEQSQTFQTCSQRQDQNTQKRILESYQNKQEYSKYKIHDFPKQWDWRNIDGINYLQSATNQHIPVYCGSCWAQAISGIIGDRINILRKNKFPRIILSPQVLINCNAGGNCNGGDPNQALQFVENNGLPEESCQTYRAQNDPDQSCNDIQKFYNLLQKMLRMLVSSPFINLKAQCLHCQNEYQKVENHQIWLEIDQSIGMIDSVIQMKAELFKHGPIACALEVSDQFIKYDGKSIFSEQKNFPQINHELAIVGWGEELGQEYWIGRNSWGTYWGDYGYFKINMYNNNMGIEKYCSYAYPEV